MSKREPYNNYISMIKKSANNNGSGDFTNNEQSLCNIQTRENNITDPGDLLMPTVASPNGSEYAVKLGKRDKDSNNNLLNLNELKASNADIMKSSNILKEQDYTSDSSQPPKMCERHLNQQAKYYVESEANKQFCSQCALNMALKGEKIYELLSEQEKFRKKHTQQFLRKLDFSRDTNQKQCLRLEERIEEIRNHYRQHLEEVLQIFSELQTVMNDFKQETVNQINQRFASDLKLTQDMKNQSKCFEIEMSKFHADIDGNFDNIVRDMQMQPFRNIITHYNERVSQFEDFISQLDAQFQCLKLNNNQIHIKQMTQSFLINIFSQSNSGQPSHYLSKNSTQNASISGTSSSSSQGSFIDAQGVLIIGSGNSNLLPNLHNNNNLGNNNNNNNHFSSLNNSSNGGASGQNITHSSSISSLNQNHHTSSTSSLSSPPIPVQLNNSSSNSGNSQGVGHSKSNSNMSGNSNIGNPPAMIGVPSYLSQNNASNTFSILQNGLSTHMMTANSTNQAPNSTINNMNTNNNNMNFIIPSGVLGSSSSTSNLENNLGNQVTQGATSTLANGILIGGGYNPNNYSSTSSNPQFGLNSLSQNNNGGPPNFGTNNSSGPSVQNKLNSGLNQIHNNSSNSSNHSLFKSNSTARLHGGVPSKDLSQISENQQLSERRRSHSQSGCSIVQEVSTSGLQAELENLSTCVPENTGMFTHHNNLSNLIGANFNGQINISSYQKNTANNSSNSMIVGGLNSLSFLQNGSGKIKIANVTNNGLSGNNGGIGLTGNSSSIIGNLSSQTMNAVNAQGTNSSSTADSCNNQQNRSQKNSMNDSSMSALNINCKRMEFSDKQNSFLNEENYQVSNNSNFFNNSSSNNNNNSCSGGNNNQVSPQAKIQSQNLSTNQLLNSKGKSQNTNPFNLITTGFLNSVYIGNNANNNIGTNAMNSATNLTTKKNLNSHNPVGINTNNINDNDNLNAVPSSSNSSSTTNAINSQSPLYSNQQLMTNNNKSVSSINQNQQPSQGLIIAPVSVTGSTIHHQRANSKQPRSGRFPENGTVPEKILNNNTSALSNGNELSLQQRILRELNSHHNNNSTSGGESVYTNLLNGPAGSQTTMNTQSNNQNFGSLTNIISPQAFSQENVFGGQFYNNNTNSSNNNTNNINFNNSLVNVPDSNHKENQPRFSMSSRTNNQYPNQQ